MPHAARQITFGSVCSGIEAASMAWGPLGWRAAFLSEIEAAPRAVLAARHGAWDVGRADRADGPPLFADFTAIRVRHLRRLGVAMPDVLAGGTPCQSFSFAGKRQSLADARGNLSLAFVKLAHALDAARQHDGDTGLAVVWENVPGCLSTADNAFGCLLAAFVGADAPLCSPLERGRWSDAGMVAGPRARAAWRIFDAQYFGLAQRRRRVVLVVGFRNGPDPAAILFERAGVSGNPPARRQARQDLAGTLNARASGGGGLGTDFELGGGLIAEVAQIAIAINLRGRAGGSQMEVDDLASLRAAVGGSSRSYVQSATGSPAESDQRECRAVRRLTPVECERLQGFPDGYTLVEYPTANPKGRMMADGPRYKMLGNSWAVPLFAAIGQRLDAALRGLPLSGDIIVR